MQMGITPQSMWGNRRDADGNDHAKYVGESARSACERFTEHIKDAEAMKKGSHIWKHWTIQHAGKRTEFQFKILGFFTSPLERQVAESVWIAVRGATMILNSKMEYNRSTLPRIISIDVPYEETLGDSSREIGQEWNEDDKVDDLFEDEGEWKIKLS